MRQKTKCLKCLKSFHIKCSTVDKKQYFQYCTDYSWLKCDKHDYDKQPGILCNICNLWVHRSCAGISKKKYEDLQNSDNDEPCYCRPCKKDCFLSLSWQLTSWSNCMKITKLKIKISIIIPFVIHKISE